MNPDPAFQPPSPELVERVNQLVTSGYVAAGLLNPGLGDDHPERQGMVADWIMDDVAEMMGIEKEVAARIVTTCIERLERQNWRLVVTPGRPPHGVNVEFQRVKAHP